jgi:hypothetical protein
MKRRWPAFLVALLAWFALLPPLVLSASKKVIPWMSPELLQEPGLAHGDPSRRAVGVDEQGRIIALTCAVDPDLGSIRVFAHRFDGTQWLSPVAIDGGGPACGPSIAMAATGEAWAVFTQTGPYGGQVFARFFDGHSWGGIHDLGWGNGPIVGITQESNAFVAYNDNRQSAIYVHQFDGILWPRVREFHPLNGDSLFLREMTVSAEGQVIVLGTSYSGHIQLLSHEFDGVSWKGPSVLNASADGDPFEATVCFSTGKIAYVVFTEGHRDFCYQMIMRRFDGFEWGAPTYPAEGRCVSYTSWAMGSGETGVGGYVSAYRGIFARVFTDGVWADEKKLKKAKKYDISFPQIASDSQGRAILTWLQENKTIAAGLNGGRWTKAAAVGENDGLYGHRSIGMNPQGVGAIVTNGPGSSTNTVGFYAVRFVLPKVSSLPSAGSVGETITLQGQGFAGKIKVYIGTKKAKVLSWTDRQISCRIPKLPPGTYPVKLQDGFWTDTLIPPFTVR